MARDLEKYGISLEKLAQDSPEAAPNRAAVGLLVDLPGEMVAAAAIDLAARREFPTWPMLMVPAEEKLTAVEAFDMARAAAAKMCPEYLGGARRTTSRD